MDAFGTQLDKMSEIDSCGIFHNKHDTCYTLQKSILTDEKRNFPVF